MLKNKFAPILISSFLAFIIPFYPVYVLLTDTGRLELAAILFLQMMVVNIPVGFGMGLGVYRLLTKSNVRILSVWTQIFVFLLFSLTPIAMFGARSYQESIRYQKNTNDFAVTAIIGNERIITKNDKEGESHLLYEYDVNLNNASTRTFNSVLVTSSVRTQNGDYFFSPNSGNAVVLPPGTMTISNSFDLSQLQLSNVLVTDLVTHSIRVYNEVTGIYKDYSYTSKITNWKSVANKLLELKAELTPPDGYSRYRNSKKGVQIDYPMGWIHGYGSERGAPPTKSEDATNHSFGKSYVGNIILQWDNYLPQHDFCVGGKLEANIQSLMSTDKTFLTTYNKLLTKGIKVRVCVENEAKVTEIQKTLETLKVI